MSDTHSYYEQNAEQFFADTIDVDMSALYARFLEAIPVGGYILDAGCGSGRDAKAFAACGYRVAAFDASPALASLCRCGALPKSASSSYAGPILYGHLSRQQKARPDPDVWARATPRTAVNAADLRTVLRKEASI